MKMSAILLRGLLVLLILTSGLRAGTTPDLLGAWKTVSYTLSGVEYPLEGLMIFTPKYYSANTMFEDQNGEVMANANAGPYRVQNGTILFEQWMQLHFRPSDPEENFVRKGPDEESEYRIEGDRLFIIFPSGNRYVLERLPEGPKSGDE